MRALVILGITGVGAIAGGVLGGVLGVAFGNDDPMYGYAKPLYGGATAGAFLGAVVGAGVAAVVMA